VPLNQFSKDFFKIFWPVIRNQGFLTFDRGVSAAVVATNEIISFLEYGEIFIADYFGSIFLALAMKPIFLFAF
jgi:hypothetical protein